MTRILIAIDLPEQEPDETNMGALRDILGALAASVDSMEDRSDSGELVEFGYAGGDHGESVQVELQADRPVDSFGVPTDERLGGSDALDHVAYTLAEHYAGKRDRTDTIQMIDYFTRRAGRDTDGKGAGE